MSSTRKLVFCPLIALLLTAATCPPAGPPEPIVTVHYRQIGACNGYKQTNGPGGAGPVLSAHAGVNGAFVVFKVLSIDNSKRSTPFDFDPDRMFVNGTSPEEHISTSLSVARDLFPRATVPVTVPAGKHQPNDGFAVVRVSTAASADPAFEANETNYQLLYGRAPGDPIVFMEKQNLSQTTFPKTQDCTKISF